jgi:hypothetical protein
MMEPNEELSLEAQLTQATVVRKEMQELLENRGWLRLMAQVQEMQDDRVRKLVLQPLQSIDAVAEQEFEKGKIAQLMIVAQMPEDIISSLDTTIETLNAQLEKQNENLDP